MSKRSERIATAKARTAEETAAMRARERTRSASSNVARFIGGPAKGKMLADVMAEMDAIKQARKERDALLQRKRM